MAVILDGSKIDIPFPRPTQNVNRGYLHKNPKTYPTSLRLTDEDRATVDKAAHSIGMSFGEFTRWCAYYAAIAVNNEIQRREFEESHVAERDTSGYK